MTPFVIPEVVIGDMVLNENTRFPLKTCHMGRLVVIVRLDRTIQKNGKMRTVK